jgi:lysophospholipase L1-like esterase
VHRRVTSLTSIVRTVFAVVLLGLVTATAPGVATASASTPATPVGLATSVTPVTAGVALAAAPVGTAPPPSPKPSPAPKKAAPKPAAQPAPGPAGGKRTAIVALGDSTASGEGAGDYDAGTKGEKGDWCHRSSHAYVRHTGLASTAFNLSCSGATSANVGFGTAVHDTEGSQAKRLAQLAKNFKVTTVITQFGANDDPSFANLMVRCVAVYLNPSLPGCATSLGGQWQSKLAAMKPKVQHALADVRDAMRQAGYQDQDYTLVVASYASPVTETMVSTHGFIGCPFRKEDAKWGRTTAVPQLSNALRAVADQVGARFLDLSRATEGHEACTSQGVEWQRRLTVDPKVFANGGISAASHLAQESFHPNAIAHAQLASCLTSFVRGGAKHGMCLPGKDGKLRAQAGDAGPVPVLAR